ncbi:MAG: PEGA domain-containing protein [Deltaproteobacteria bacterium]|nr:PEGA domain-containing protein [Deltaproteobacteria bacterium]
MRAFLWIFAAGVLTMGRGSVAVAQGESTESATSDEASDPADVARQHMEQGQELYVQERYLEAAEEFKAAYEAQPSGAFLYNAAVAYERNADYGRAADFFARYLEADPDAEDADEVRRRVDLLRTRAAGQDAARDGGVAVGVAGGTQAGDGTDASTDPAVVGQDGQDGQDAAAIAASEASLTVAIGETTAEQMKSLVSIRTNPAGAEVTIRRGEVDVTSGPAPLAPTVDHGQYRVVVEHPDYRTVEAGVNVRPGHMYVIIVEMSQGQFMGHLRVTSDVPGARVFLDDHDAGEVGRTPWSNVVPVGTHRVWVERPGYDPHELEVEVGLGETTETAVALNRSTDGRVRVSGNIRGSRIFIDGNHVGDVPWEGAVAAGPHRIEVAADGMKRYGARIEVERGQMTPVRVRLRPSPDRGGAWATLVAGALFVGGGITAAVIGANIRSELEAERDAGALANDDDRISTGQILFIAADIAFGVAIVLGGLSLYYFLTDTLPDSTGTVLEPRDWAVAPFITPTGAGAAGSWNF